jgi:HEAT repeat protein
LSEIAKITKLLHDESFEKQMAAAIVLGELRAKGPEVVQGLVHTLASDVPLLQRHALLALARVGAKRALSQIFPLLSSSDADVRRAAVEAVVSVGEEVVPTIRTRIAAAAPEERRALDAILAELGGKDAFTTLLAGLVSGDPDAAKAAAISVRQRIKGADGRQRRSYLAETEKFLEKQAKPKNGEKNVAAVAAAVQILGYLEDEKTLPLLLSYAGDAKQPPNVRQEALIALRFVLGEKTSAPVKVIETLIDAAAAPDRTLAQTALHTLGSLELSSGVSKRLEKLVAHPELERARFVIEQLGRQKDEDAARILVKVVGSLDRRRAEFAAGALTGNDAAITPLAKALLETKDVDRAWVMRNVLRPNAKKVPPALRKQLLEVAIERFGSGERGWEALLDIVRDAEPDSVATALRTLVAKLKKQKNVEKTVAVLHLLCRSDRATDDDRFALASLELGKSSRDTRPASRASDDALRQLGALLGRGYDVVTALRKDRSVELEHMFYVGFHFAEEGHPAGEDLLQEVVKRGGRAKIAKMAKNKLSLVSSSEG